jgi:hypothetical protein
MTALLSNFGLEAISTFRSTRFFCHNPSEPI